MKTLYLVFLLEVNYFVAAVVEAIHTAVSKHRPKTPMRQKSLFSIRFVDTSSRISP
jgi:hypothetical protein